MDLEIRAQCARHGKDTGIGDKDSISAALQTYELNGMLKTAQILFGGHYIQSHIALDAMLMSIGNSCLHLFFVEIIGESTKTVTPA